ncbi:MAG: hypothetical protein H5T49_05775 [Hadesarchaea archaeon]|nr:hypothetical protein [Hadesarchaea archaeon]
MFQAVELLSMGIEKAKYKELVADADVLRWYRNVARGSKATADFTP